MALLHIQFFSFSGPSDIMVSLIAAVLLVIAPSLVSSQSSKHEWFPDEMYNPLVEPRRCGLNSDEPSYICDPNGITGDHGK